MITGLFVSLLANSPQAAPLEWAKVSHAYRLIDVVDDDGVGVLNENNTLTIFNPDGKFKKLIKVPLGKNPLYYCNKPGLFLASRRPISILGDDGEEGGWNGSRLEYFAQGDHVFAITSGVSSIDLATTCTMGDYDELSCVGIDPEGETIAHIRTSFAAPCLEVARRHGRDWDFESDFRTPLLPRIGIAYVLPGCNDLRFVGKDTVAFIGTIAPVPSAELQAKIGKTSFDLTKFPISWMGTRKDETRYLFTMKLGSGLVMCAAKLSVEQRVERGEPVVGRFTVSHSGKWIYLLTRDNVLRLSVEDVLAKGFYN